MSLWDSLRVVAQSAGQVAQRAGHKTKLRADILLVDREMNARQHAFGVELYEHLEPLASQPEFFQADDRLTETVRGPFLVAQREVAALVLRKNKLKEDQNQAQVRRKAAFSIPATTFGEKMTNAGRSAGMATQEAKLYTELSLVESQIRYHKQQFGLELLAILIKLEESEGWLPTDRDVRSMYDQARRDVERIKAKRAAKVQEIEALGGTVEQTASNGHHMNGGGSFSATVNGGHVMNGGHSLSSTVNGVPPYGASASSPADSTNSAGYMNTSQTSNGSSAYTAPAMSSAMPGPTTTPQPSIGAGAYAAPVVTPATAMPDSMASAQSQNLPSGVGAADPFSIFAYQESQASNQTPAASSTFSQRDTRDLLLM